MKSRKEPDDALSGLAAPFRAHASCIRACVAAELAVLAPRLRSALLRVITTAPAAQPRSLTTTVPAPGAPPEPLPLDGLPRDPAPRGCSPGSPGSSSRANTHIALDVHHCYTVAGPAGPTPVYAVAAACMGGYHATVYRRGADVAALQRRLGHRARTPAFAAPTGAALADPAALAASCAELKRLLDKLVRGAAAHDRAAVLAWLGLDRALARTPADAAVDAAFADVWRYHYSDDGPACADTPEAVLAAHLAACATRAVTTTTPAGKGTGTGTTTRTTTTTTAVVPLDAGAMEQVQAYAQKAAAQALDVWRARAATLMGQFAALPAGAYADAVEDALEGVHDVVREMLAPFLEDAAPLLQRVLRVLTPLVKGVRHTVREYLPRTRATFALLLKPLPAALAAGRDPRQGNEHRKTECDDLHKKLVRVKAKVLGAAEYAACTYRNDPELALGAGVGDSDECDSDKCDSDECDSDSDSARDDVSKSVYESVCESAMDDTSEGTSDSGFRVQHVRAQLLGLLGVLPVLVHAWSYQLQPKTIAMFTEYFLVECDRLARDERTRRRGRVRAADVLAERMSSVLPLVERNLVLAAQCAHAHVTNDVLAAHAACAAQPPLSALHALLRAFDAALARATVQHVCMYVNIARIFVGTLAEAPSPATPAPSPTPLPTPPETTATATATPTATATATATPASTPTPASAPAPETTTTTTEPTDFVAAAARSAFADGTAMLARHAARALPRTLTDLATALLLGPALAGLGARTQKLVNALGRCPHPVLRELLDDAGLVETCVTRVLRAAVEPLVRDWVAELTHRPWDPARTARAVALRRERRREEQALRHPPGPSA